MQRILLSLILVAAPASAGIVVLKSEQPYMKGNYAAFAGPWSRWIDHSITDYSNAIRISTAQWPSNVGMSWRFPDKYASTGVYGYNYLAYGQYWDLKPPGAVTPRKISDIRTLSFSADVHLTGDAANYNVLAEFFLTKQAGKIDSRLVEIGWLLNMPQRTKEYFDNGKQIGAYTDAHGRKWLVASHNDGAAGHYILFAPDRPEARSMAPIDALASVKWLAARNEVDPGSYFNGMAVGAEPLRGAGGIQIRKFDVTFN